MLGVSSCLQYAVLLGRKWCWTGPHGIHSEEQLEHEVAASTYEAFVPDATVFVIVEQHLTHVTDR